MGKTGSQGDAGEKRRRKTENKGKSKGALRMRTHSSGSTGPTVTCLCDAGDSQIIPQLLRSSPAAQGVGGSYCLPAKGA